MAAPDHLGLQFNLKHYPPSESGISFDQYRLAANVGETEVGHMSWSHKGVHFIEATTPRQGIATALWNEGHRLAAENPAVVRPQHSADRTDSGDAWARAVGGRLPRRKRDAG
jgi:hypothetical protein